LSDFTIIDVGSFAIVIFVILTVSHFVWRKYLSKLDSRYQTIIDIIAIIFSGLVILSMANLWLFQPLSWLGL
jgi:hypothetical protein